MKRVFIFAALCLVASCAPRPETPAISPLSVSVGDKCGASSYEYLTGQDATALERVYILGQVRMIRPGTPVTRDLRPDRLNFDVDRQGRITRVFCG